MKLRDLLNIAIIMAAFIAAFGFVWHVTVAKDKPEVKPCCMRTAQSRDTTHYTMTEEYYNNCR